VKATVLFREVHGTPRYPSSEPLPLEALPTTTPLIPSAYIAPHRRTPYLAACPTDRLGESDTPGRV